MSWASGAGSPARSTIQAPDLIKSESPKTVSATSHRPAMISLAFTGATIGTKPGTVKRDEQNTIDFLHVVAHFTRGLKRTIIYILSTNYAGSHYLSLLLGSNSRSIHLGEIKRLRDARMHERRAV